MKKTFITTLLSLGFVVAANAAVVTLTDGSSDNYTVGTDNVGTPVSTGSYTIYGTLTDAGHVTVAPTDPQTGVTYTNAYFYGDQNPGQGLTSHSLCQVSSSGDASSISGANITVSGQFDVRHVSLAGSNVTVQSGAVLQSRNNSNFTLTLGTLSVEAGGKVASNGGANVSYTGAIDLALGDTLTSYDATSKTLSTTALYGVMQTGASLTLDLSGVTALSSYKMGDSFTLELTNLTQASGFDTTGNFTATGWDVVYNTASGKTSLTLTKTIPEPTTATLSLLALAGLAARRRRK